jgi:hypothetical protein
MVSSDFGKLEVRRHFTSGDDCAMAGEATAVAAAPAAETFKKSRRFISSLSLVGMFPGNFVEHLVRRLDSRGRQRSGPRALARKPQSGNATKA